jgi:hypothetical protein
MDAASQRNAVQFYTAAANLTSPEATALAAALQRADGPTQSAFSYFQSSFHPLKTVLGTLCEIKVESAVAVAVAAARQSHSSPLALQPGNVIDGPLPEEH